MQTKSTMPMWTDSQIMVRQDYQIHHYLNKDFKTVNLHSHDFYEIYLFGKGKATYTVENNRYALYPGDIMLIPPNSLHQLYIQDSSCTYERYVLWLHPAYIAMLSTATSRLETCFDVCKMSNNYLIRNEQLSNSIKNYMENLLLYEENHAFAKDIICRNIVSNILINLCNNMLSSQENDKSYKDNIRNARIQEVLSYIDSHIQDDLSLDTISKHVFISKYYLTRIFREEIGASLHQYILKKRLVCAKELISQNMPIVSVYTKVGFSDYSHFFRAFKKEFGITPKQYYTLL